MSPLTQLTRPWEIYLVHHTHVDIGYTEPQPIILRKHAEYLAQALDLCAQTDALPAGERFCWTCEVSWTVKAFLQRYPERAEEFFRRVREGRIEITGLYLQLTDLFGERLLEAALEYAEELTRAHGVEIVTAMNDDVNGWAWGLPKLLAARGIKYFDVAINETRSLGVRPRPAPLHWASPGGERVLMWHGDGYTRANALDFSSAGGAERVAAYLRGLEEQGYPHHVIELRMQSYGGDNGPPAAWLTGVVQAWNREHPELRMRLATPRTWFAELESHWPRPIPEHRAGWPDWWADGNGSALYESALARQAQADLDDTAAVAVAGGEVDAERRESAREAAMFFCEHTWGAWCSTDDPDAVASRAGWNFKAGYAYTAGVQAAQLLGDALRSCWTPGEGGPTIAVFNPLPWPRTDLVEVHLPDVALLGGADGWVPCPQREEAGPPLYLHAATGETVVAARLPVIGDCTRRPAQRIRFLAREVPAQGWKEYRVVPGETQAPPGLTRVGDNSLENDHFRLVVDAQTGGLRSLVDQATGRELIASGEYTLNQHIYETIDDPAGRYRLVTWEGPQYDVPFRRRTPEFTLQPAPAGPGGAGLVVTGGGGETPQLRAEYILYDDLPRVDIINTLIKPGPPTPESVYHAFPLAARAPVVYLDVPGGPLRPGLDQVPGTATDWHGVQDYFAVADEDYTVVVATPDVPLVQVNGLNTGKWQPQLPPPNGTVMSWVLNNYWFTNFPASQSGRITFRYALTGLPGPFDPAAMERFGREQRHPLRALLLPAGGRRRTAVRS